jgi:hypothetical protein
MEAFAAVTKAVTASLAALLAEETGAGASDAEPGSSRTR